MINPEWAGVPAAVLVLISYIFSNQLKLRIINTAACVAFTVYGVLIGMSSGWTAGYSTIILNAMCVMVHIYYIVKLTRERKNRAKAIDAADGQQQKEA